MANPYAGTGGTGGPLSGLAGGAGSQWYDPSGKQVSEKSGFVRTPYGSFLTEQYGRMGFKAGPTGIGIGGLPGFAGGQAGYGGGGGGGGGGGTGMTFEELENKRERDRLATQMMGENLAQEKQATTLGGFKIAGEEKFNPKHDPLYGQVTRSGLQPLQTRPHPGIQPELREDGGSVKRTSKLWRKHMMTKIQSKEMGGEVHPYLSSPQFQHVMQHGFRVGPLMKEPEGEEKKQEETPAACDGANVKGMSNFQTAGVIKPIPANRTRDMMNMKPLVSAARGASARGSAFQPDFAETPSTYFTMTDPHDWRRNVRVGSRGPAPLAPAARESGLNALYAMQASGQKARMIDPMTGLPERPSSIQIYRQLQNVASQGTRGGYSPLQQWNALANYYEAKRTGNPELIDRATQQMVNIRTAIQEEYDKARKAEMPEEPAETAEPAAPQASPSTLAPEDQGQLFGKQFSSELGSMALPSVATVRPSTAAPGAVASNRATPIVPAEAEGGEADDVHPYLVNEEGMESYQPKGEKPQPILGGPQIKTFPKDGKVIPHKRTMKLLRDGKLHLDTGGPVIQSAADGAEGIGSKILKGYGRYLVNPLNVLPDILPQKAPASRAVRAMNEAAIQAAKQAGSVAVWPFVAPEEPVAPVAPPPAAKPKKKKAPVATPIIPAAPTEPTAPSAPKLEGFDKAATTLPSVSDIKATQPAPAPATPTPEDMAQAKVTSAIGRMTGQLQPGVVSKPGITGVQPIAPLYEGRTASFLTPSGTASVTYGTEPAKGGTTMMGGKPSTMADLLRKMRGEPEPQAPTPGPAVAAADKAMDTANRVLAMVEEQKRRRAESEKMAAEQTAKDLAAAKQAASMQMPESGEPGYTRSPLGMQPEEEQPEAKANGGYIQKTGRTRALLKR